MAIVTVPSADSALAPSTTPARTRITGASAPANIAPKTPSCRSTWDAL